MRLLIICAVALCLVLTFSSCSDKQSSVSAKSDSSSSVQTDTAAESEETVSPLEGEVFEELPEDAVECFNCIAGESEEIFADADGKWMYGYKGTATIESEECYVFAVYTYKNKTHSKEGVVAANVSGESIYLFNDETEEFEPVALTERESSWADTQTLAFVK